MRVSLGDSGLAAALVRRAVVDDNGSADLTLLDIARQPRGHPGRRRWSPATASFRPPWPGIGGVHVDRTGRTTVAWDDRSPDGVWRVVAVRAVQGQSWQQPKVLARHVGWGDFPVVVTGAPRGDVGDLRPAAGQPAARGSPRRPAGRHR
ncbi:hypothetical protein [Nocardioides sp.]|uniref:hypothetical protein n=1 Tax=Nocardioides sp. TaxID=35761 RepID=UPI003529A65A